jgi:hypothetical protein
MSSWVSDSWIRTTPAATCSSADDSNKNLASLPEIKCDRPIERNEITCIPTASADMWSRLQGTTAVLREEGKEGRKSSRLTKFSWHGCIILSPPLTHTACL